MINDAFQPYHARYAKDLENAERVSSDGKQGADDARLPVQLLVLPVYQTVVLIEDVVVHVSYPRSLLMSVDTPTQPPVRWFFPLQLFFAAFALENHCCCAARLSEVSGPGKVAV